MVQRDLLLRGTHIKTQTKHHRNNKTAMTVSGVAGRESGDCQGVAGRESGDCQDAGGHESAGCLGHRNASGSLDSGANCHIDVSQSQQPQESGLRRGSQRDELIDRAVRAVVAKLHLQA